MVDPAAVFHWNYWHFGLVQDTCAYRIPVASLAPTDYCALQIFGQWLIGTRQTGVAYPGGGVDCLGKAAKRQKI